VEHDAATGQLPRKPLRRRLLQTAFVIEHAFPGLFRREGADDLTRLRDGCVPARRDVRGPRCRPVEIEAVDLALGVADPCTFLDDPER